ncbi:MAG TPA: hypothetical protein VE404_01470 [Verrucomicrobiae bacterium]|nr:hypothetical protein [Verrucomicrobiae bacterium]
MKNAVTSLARRGDGYLLESPLDVPGWEPRKFRRAAVIVEGVRHYVAGRHVKGPGVFEYELRPWSDAYHDPPAEEIVCDAAFLRALTVASRARDTASALHDTMKILKPLVGFLPAATKLRLQETYGVHPGEATTASIFLEYLILAVAGALLSVNSFTMSHVLPGGALWTVVGAVAPDALVRYGRVLHGEISPPGFYEWLVRMRWR